MRPCKGTSNFCCPGDEGRKEWMWSAVERWKREVEERRRVNSVSSIIWVPAVSPPPPEAALIDLLTRAQTPPNGRKQQKQDRVLGEAYHTRELHTSFTQFLQLGVCLFQCHSFKRGFRTERQTFPVSIEPLCSFFLCSKRNENLTAHHWILLYIQTNIFPISHKQNGVHACMHKAAHVESWADRQTDARAHTCAHTHTRTGRVLNPPSLSPREQTCTVVCGLVEEMESEERWGWRDWKNDEAEKGKAEHWAKQDGMERERSDSEAIKKMRDKNTDWQQAATGILSFLLTQNVKK